MTGENPQDELILRHLDGETSPEEVARITGMLSTDAAFRFRFFTFANLIVEVQENLSLFMGNSPASPGSPSAMLTLPLPRQVQVENLSASIDIRRIYFNAVLGGAGGLAGWLLVSLLGSILSLDELNVYVKDAVNGLLVGVCIGFAVGGSEGLIGARSLKRLLRDGRYGAALGAAGGLLGLVLGELVLNLLGGGVLARALGWGLFGMFVGSSDGVAQKMPVKIRYGILGGLLGGLIGGSTYECLLSLFRSGGGLMWGSAIGLIIVGACIGFLASLVEALLRKAWLFFITGRLEGQTRTLDSSRPHTLGSDAGCTIVLPGDATLAPIHAEVFFNDGEFQVRPRDGQVIVRRDGSDQPVALAQTLAPGDRVVLGDTRMIFRNVEAKKS